MQQKINHFRRFHGSQILFLCTMFLILSNLSMPHQTATSVDHRTSDIVDNSQQHRQLLSYNGDPLATEPWLKFENPRLKNAYIALQAWKEAILSDPKNITANWVGPDVCRYTGVFCWPAPDDQNERTVAGIDINHGDIAGNLPHELGLLYDLALFHLNSNRFCGTIPQSFVNWKLLFELDLSSNHFAGKFPEVILQLRSLRYLDIRYNEFEGELPKGLFEKDFDAIFINNNRFSFAVPDNIGKSRVSVIVMANNKFAGCVPDSIGDMNSLEQLNLAHNRMSGKISTTICQLPNLVNFVYDYNYFSDESPACLQLPKFDDRMNCFRDRLNQRSAVECQRFLSQRVNCSSFNCDTSSNPLPISPPPVYSPPPSTRSPSPPPHPPPPSPPPSPPPPSPFPPYFSSPPPPPSISPPLPFFSPSPPCDPQPLPAPPSSTPVDISASPTLPPIISPPPLSNSAPSLCPCLKPPPQPSHPPSNF